MSVKLIVSDIDGTLVDSSEAIAPLLLETIEKLEQRGIIFTFATGRTKELTNSFVKALELPHPYIISNGACIFQGDKCLREHGFSVKPVLDILREADAAGLTVTIADEYRELALSETVYVKEHQQFGGRFQEPFPWDETNWDTAKFQKIMLLDEHKVGKIEPFRAALSKFEHLYAVTTFSERAVELGPLGCNKATGVTELAGMLGVDIKDVMACGDFSNDKEMIAAVGYGVAVANANDEIKQIARYVATKSYAYGVVEAIEKFCFGEE